MKKMLIPAALLVSVLVFSGCAKQEAVDQKPTPSPTPIIEVTPPPTPTITPTPTPTPETTPAATPEPTPTYELPPVPTVYNEKADLNDDGHIEKSEWEQWVSAHPEDLDQDMVITSEEQAAYDKAQNPPVQTPAPSPKPSNTTKPSGGNDSGGVTTPPPAVQTPAPPAPPAPSTGISQGDQEALDALDKWSEEQKEGKTQEQIDEANKNQQQGC